MGNGIQTQVGGYQAPAVEGDFASANPYFSVDAGPNGLIAGILGLTVGLFAWTVPPTDGDGFPAAANNFGAGAPTGFVHRDQQGLITTYLADASMTIPKGFQVTLMKGGDFWIRNAGATAAVPGQKAYALNATGQARFGATGSPTQGATSTASTIAPATNAFTGSILGDRLTVTGGITGTIVPGTTVSGSGVASGTMITSQISGTTGGVGVYAVNIPNQSVAAGTAMTGAYGLLTIGGTLTGSFGVGDLLGGSATPAAGTTITGLGTGSGGAGTYYVNISQTVNSGQITANSDVETKWICMSYGGTGELVKISNVANG